MLTLTRKTGYALIAMSHLAAARDRVVSAREIAERYRVPLALLMNLLKMCAAKGLVESIRGAKGGYRLGRPAGQISLAELVEAIEGPVRIGQCHGQAEREAGVDCEAICQVGSCCPARAAVSSVHMRLQGLLAEMTIEDVAKMAAEATGKAVSLEDDSGQRDPVGGTGR